MGVKKAKLNLDFGHNGISVNFAVEKDSQPREGIESDWNVGTFAFNDCEFEDFPGTAQDKIDEGRIKAIANCIEKSISEWQRENGCDFDSLMEVTISANFFDVLYSPVSFWHSKFKIITENDMRGIEIDKYKKREAPIQSEKIRAFISPYFTISNEENATVKLLNPLGAKTKSLGFDVLYINKLPAVSRLLEVMKDDDEKIRISLSCEKEFRALANKDEKEGKTALIHITNTLSEFSVWDKSELKYFNTKEGGLIKLKEIFWHLCLYYHKYPELIKQDFEFKRESKDVQKIFYDKIKNSSVSEDSKELLSADDCLDLLEGASCILENETEDIFKYSRFALPGKNKAKTGFTISNYILCYFAREAIRDLLLEIKQTMDKDKFCEPKSIIIECPLPLKGIERLAGEVFGIPARRAVVKWDQEPRDDLSSSAVGALQSLIEGEKSSDSAEVKKKTTKFAAILEYLSKKL